jgi:hypothetical protein
LVDEQFLVAFEFLRGFAEACGKQSEVAVGADEVVKLEGGNERWAH